MLPDPLRSSGSTEGASAIMSDVSSTDKLLHPLAPSSPAELRAKIRSWQGIQDQNIRAKHCRLALILKNESVWCGSRDQWVSERLCLLCTDYEPVEGIIPSRPTEDSVRVVQEDQVMLRGKFVE